jgi:hypothetical protein
MAGTGDDRDDQAVLGFLEKEVDSSSPSLPQIPAETNMTEERKHAILFAATLLSARKIIDALDSSKPKPGKDFFIDKAIKEAAAILEKIDQRWPTS